MSGVPADVCYVGLINEALGSLARSASTKSRAYLIFCESFTLEQSKPEAVGHISKTALTFFMKLTLHSKPDDFSVL